MVPGGYKRGRKNTIDEQLLTADAGQERQIGRKAQTSNITAAKA